MTIKELRETLKPGTTMQVSCNGYEYDVGQDVNSPIFQSVSHYIIDKIDVVEKNFVKAEILMIPAESD